MAIHHLLNYLAMIERNKKVVFVASTGAHAEGLIELANKLYDRGLIKPALLEFPSGLHLYRTHAQSMSFIDVFIWHGNSVFRRNEINIIKTSSDRGNPLVFALDYVLRSVISRAGGIFSLLFLYAAMAICAINQGGKWLCRKLMGAQDFHENRLLREICIDAFRVVGKFKFLVRFAKGPLLGGVIQYAIHRVFFGILNSESELMHLGRFFTSYKPDLIVLPEQNCGYSHQVLMAWSRQSGVPILVMPYTLAGREEWANSFANRPGCQVQGLLRHILARAFPEWTYVYRDKLLIPPIEWLVTSEYLGCAPSIPWVTNSGPDVVVAIDNLFTKNFYAHEGVDTTKWHVVGSIADDRLHVARKKRQLLAESVSARLGLPPDNPMILIGLPPDQFSMNMPGKLEFANYQDLASFMISTAVRIAGGHWNIVINLHPRIKLDDLDGLDLSEAKIFTGPIAEVLPAAHLYVSVSSATIRWAIACGIPVLNFDAYRYNYRDYAGLEGVVDVKTRSDFESQLQLILSDSSLRNRLAESQTMDAGRFFMVDGKAEDRISCLIEELATAPQKHPDPR